MDTMQAAAQDWITTNWGKDSYDPKSDYFNCEALLVKLNAREKQSRGERDMEEAMLLNALYDRVQIMREIALNRA